MGPIAPAGWDRFFDFTGTPYAGPAYPQVDPTPPPFEKFGAAEAEVRDEVRHRRAVPEAGTGVRRRAAGDTRLPTSCEPARDRATCCSARSPIQLMTGAESVAQLGMTVTEGPHGLRGPGARPRADLRGDLLPRRGVLRVTVDGEEHLLTRGDFVSIPAGVEHTLRDGGAPDAVCDHVRTGRRRALSRGRRRGRRAPDLPRAVPNRSIATACSSGGSRRTRHRVRRLTGARPWISDSP